MTLNWIRLQCVDYSRSFNGLGGLRIHKAHKLKERNFPIRECKSIDGVMKMGYSPSIENSAPEKFKQVKYPIAQKYPESYLNKSWPTTFIYIYNQSYGSHSAADRFFFKIIYEVCFERKKKKKKQPNPRRYKACDTTTLTYASEMHTLYHHHHHHHVVPLARISLTLSRHFSLSFIASGRSSGIHPLSSHSCYMYVRAGRPAFAWPYAGVHRSTSLMGSSLLLQQCPACLVRLTWIVFVMGGRWPYSWCLVGCCCQDTL